MRVPVSLSLSLSFPISFSPSFPSFFLFLNPSPHILPLTSLIPSPLTSIPSPSPLLTQHPLHDQHFSPGELSGLDPEHLARVVSDGLVGQVLDPLETVRGVDDQQAQEEAEGHGVGHKLHEGTSQDLTQLDKDKKHPAWLLALTLALLFSY